jgi:hypothetical protein
MEEERRQQLLPHSKAGFARNQNPYFVAKIE